MNALFSRLGLYRLGSQLGRSRLAALEQAIRAGHEAYVLGFNSGTHNSGAALVRVGEGGTVELICNEEEERYTAVKHCHEYPEHSIETIKQRMRTFGIEPEDLAACVICWDYPTVVNTDIVHPLLEEAPASIALLRGASWMEHPTINQGNAASLIHASARNKIFI